MNYLQMCTPNHGVKELHRKGALKGSSHAGGHFRSPNMSTGHYKFTLYTRTDILWVNILFEMSNEEKNLYLSVD